jgi:hypothetical protein
MKTSTVQSSTRSKILTGSGTGRWTTREMIQRPCRRPRPTGGTHRPLFPKVRPMARPSHHCRFMRCTYDLPSDLAVVCHLVTLLTSLTLHGSAGVKDTFLTISRSTTSGRLCCRALMAGATVRALARKSDLEGSTWIARRNEGAS